MLCGPEVMMRYVARDSGDTRPRPRPDLSLHGAEHEVRHRLLRPLPVRSAFHLQGRPSLSLRPDRPHDWTNMSSEKTEAAKPENCGLQVRLLRRLPAQPAGCRRRTAGRCRSGGIAYFPEATRTMLEGALRHRAGRRLRSPRTTMPNAFSRSGASARRWSPSAPAPPPAAFRRCATGKTWTNSSAWSTPRPEFISTLKMSTPIAEHVPVDFELRGCPINKHQLVELIAATLAGRKPNIPTLQRLHRVQAQGECVHRGGARNRLPGTRHAGGMRRALPQLRPRLLRLLRAHGDAQHRFSDRAVPHPRAVQRPDSARVPRFQCLGVAVPRGK